MTDLICYGDSITAGFTTNGRAIGPRPGADGTVGGFVDIPWPAGVQAQLRDRGLDVVVENRGVNGTTCTNWRDGTGGVPQPWAAEMAASTAKLHLLCLGVNDGPDEVNAVYPELLDAAIAAGRALVVVTPPQILTGYGGVEGRAAAEAAAARARGLPVIDLCSYTSLMPGWAGLLSYSVIIAGYWSGIHPRQPGYGVIADLVTPAVAGLLKG